MWVTKWYFMGTKQKPFTKPSDSDTKLYSVFK